MNNCIAENPVPKKQTMTEFWPDQPEKPVEIENPGLVIQTMTEFRLDELEKAVRELQERIEQLEAAHE